MRCEDVKNRCEAFIEGRLPDQDEAAFREHLQHCASCRVHVVGRDPSQLFVSLGGQRKPPEFWAGFWEGIEEHLPRRRPWMAWIQRFEPALAYMLLAAVAFSAFFAGRALVPRAGRAPRGIEMSSEDAARGSELSIAVLRTLERRYSISGYLSARNPSAEVIDLTYNDNDANIYRVTMILDNAMEESF